MVMFIDAIGCPNRRVGDDGELAVSDRDDDAQAAELPPRAHAHLFVDVGRQQHAVRIERAEHSVDRRVLEFVQGLTIELQLIANEG